MSKLLIEFNKSKIKKDVSDVKPGDTVKIGQKIKEKDKDRIQIFEGVVIARKHGKGINATIKVRKIVGGVGVERTFPIHSPSIDKIEIVSRAKTRRAKLYYLREAKGKKSRLKNEAFRQAVAEEVVPQEEKAPQAEAPATSAQSE